MPVAGIAGSDDDIITTYQWMGGHCYSTSVWVCVFLTHLAESASYVGKKRKKKNPDKSLNTK